MKIKKFNDFISEEVSGTELVGHSMGVAYGETGLQNKTVNSHDTTEIFCDIDSNYYPTFWNITDYNDYYIKYLGTPEGVGKPLDGFSHDNIIAILQVLSPELF